MKKSITQKILSNALRKFANEFGVTTKDVQLIIYTDDNSFATPKYKVCNKYKPVKNLLFSDVYDGNKEIFSFTEKAVLSLAGSDLDKTVSQFICELLLKLSKKYNTIPDSLNVMIWTRDVQAGELMFQIYVKEEVDGKITKKDKGQIKIDEFLDS